VQARWRLDRAGNIQKGHANWPGLLATAAAARTTAAAASSAAPAKKGGR
jgi:hypothetical protein